MSANLKFDWNIKVSSQISIESTIQSLYRSIFETTGSYATVFHQPSCLCMNILGNIFLMMIQMISTDFE